MTLQGILVGNHATLYIALVQSCISLPQTCKFNPSAILCELHLN